MKKLLTKESKIMPLPFKPPYTSLPPLYIERSQKPFVKDSFFCNPKYAKHMQILLIYKYLIHSINAISGRGIVKINIRTHHIFLNSRISSFRLGNTAPTDRQADGQADTLIYSCRQHFSIICLWNANSRHY